MAIGNIPNTTPHSQPSDGMGSLTPSVCWTGSLIVRNGPGRATVMLEYGRDSNYRSIAHPCWRVSIGVKWRTIEPVSKKPHDCHRFSKHARVCVYVLQLGRKVAHRTTKILFRFSPIFSPKLFTHRGTLRVVTVNCKQFVKTMPVMCKKKKQKRNRRKEPRPH